LGAVSGSLLSLVVTPSLFSVMPSPPGLPFPKMELRRTLLPVAAAPMIMTPWLRWLEMVLAASATVPPTVLPGAPEMTLRAPAFVPPTVVLEAFPMRTPSSALPKAELPLTLVPSGCPTPWCSWRSSRRSRRRAGRCRRSFSPARPASRRSRPRGTLLTRTPSRVLPMFEKPLRLSPM
jgi:hypothetical protein